MIGEWNIERHVRHRPIRRRWLTPTGEAVLTIYGVVMFGLAVVICLGR